jgi:eukaryotic-like serine/threonine-protein kinase
VRYGGSMRWFGPFHIERQVGRGGLGAVFRAVDSRSGEAVALKMLPPGNDPLAAQRLAREFSALRQVAHPNIVRALDAGEENGIPWLAMEFIDGLGVREWLSVINDPVPLEPEPGEGAHGSEGVDLDVLFDEPDSGAMLAAARARSFLRVTSLEAALDEDEQKEANSPERLAALCEALAQICDGLAEIHGRGLVHRDLKPSNILVTPARRAILVDFGLLRRLSDDRVTDPGRVVGTYRYMAPEQAKNEAVDRRSDLYSLGATLYELLAGRPPFNQEQHYQLLQAVVGRKPPALHTLNPGAPQALCTLADRLLAKEPADRPGDAREVAMMLRGVGRRFSSGVN